MVSEEFITKFDPSNLRNHQQPRNERNLQPGRSNRNNFVLKIQVVISEAKQMKNTGNLDEDIKVFKSALLAYNKDRSVSIYLSPQYSHYADIVKEIVTNGVGGTKGYFYAIQEKNDLKINHKRIQVSEMW